MPVITTKTNSKTQVLRSTYAISRINTFPRPFLNYLTFATPNSLTSLGCQDQIVTQECTVTDKYSIPAGGSPFNTGHRKDPGMPAYRHIA